MAKPAVELRELVHARLLIAKAANEFSINSFATEESYVPYSVEDSKVIYPNGKVYLVAGVPGDIVNQSRTNRPMVQEHAVILGFQVADIVVTDIELLDGFVDLVEELADFCRKGVDQYSDTLSFSRLVWLKDENDTPFSFLAMRDNKTFEAYFTAFYNIVLQ